MIAKHDNGMVIGTVHTIAAPHHALARYHTRTVCHVISASGQHARRHRYGLPDRARIDEPALRHGMGNFRRLWTNAYNVWRELAKDSNK